MTCPAALMATPTGVENRAAVPVPSSVPLVMTQSAHDCSVRLTARGNWKSYWLTFGSITLTCSLAKILTAYWSATTSNTRFGRMCSAGFAICLAPPQSIQRCCFIWTMRKVSRPALWLADQPVRRVRVPPV